MKNNRTWQLAGLMLNLAYGVYNGVLGLVSPSWWFVTLGAYFIVLGVMRFAVWQGERAADDTVAAGFVRRFTGALLVVMSVFLVGMVYLSAVRDRGVRYHEIVMITIAAYTFTKMVVAIIHWRGARNSASSFRKTLCSIAFADALVSVLSLQRSMLVSFPGMVEQDIRLMNGLTGSAVCLLVLLMGLNLIGGRCIDMAKAKIVKVNEKIAETVVSGYKKTESAVVDGYKKVEGAVVSGYTKIEDKFVDKYLTRDGETVEEAKQRLKEQK